MTQSNLNLNAKNAHESIDNLPIDSKEYWEAIAALGKIKPPVVFDEKDMAKGSY